MKTDFRTRAQILKPNLPPRQDFGSNPYPAPEFFTPTNLVTFLLRLRPTTFSSRKTPLVPVFSVHRRNYPIQAINFHDGRNQL